MVGRKQTKGLVPLVLGISMMLGGFGGSLIYKDYLERKYPNYNTAITLREELSKPIIESGLFLSENSESERERLLKINEEYEAIKGEIKKKDRERDLGLIGFFFSSISGIPFFIYAAESLKRWRLYSRPLGED